MKKLLIRGSIAMVILIILGVLCVALFLDAAVKRGVETVGPMLTQVPVKLDSANISILSGSGSLKGLLVGNPAGYKTPSAIQVGKASLAIQPGSLFSSKVIVRSINVQAPEITFEGGLNGNNLSKIVDNLQAATGGGGTAASPKQEAKANKKLEVDDFLISGGKINLSVPALGGKSATVALPEIHLTNLGQGPDGITAAELTKLVIQTIEKEATKVSMSALSDLGKDAAGLTKGLGGSATGAVDKVTKGIGGLFKKN